MIHYKITTRIQNGYCYHLADIIHTNHHFYTAHCLYVNYGREWFRVFSRNGAGEHNLHFYNWLVDNDFNNIIIMPVGEPRWRVFLDLPDPSFDYVGIDEVTIEN